MNIGSNSEDYKETERNIDKVYKYSHIVIAPCNRQYKHNYRGHEQDEYFKDLVDMNNKEIRNEYFEWKREVFN